MINKPPFLTPQELYEKFIRKYGFREESRDGILLECNENDHDDSLPLGDLIAVIGKAYPAWHEEEEPDFRIESIDYYVEGEEAELPEGYFQQFINLLP